MRRARFPAGSRPRSGSGGVRWSAHPPADRPAPRPGRAEPGDTGRAAAEARHVGAEAGPTHRFEEVRGLWVVRTTLTSPERVRAMVASAARAGFNTLLVQVRGRGDAYYDSRWEPRAAALAGSAATSTRWRWSSGRPTPGAWPYMRG